MMTHSFCDGKYTVTNDNGKLTALRNGEPWGRDLTGDNLIYWMLVEVDRLKEALEHILTYDGDRLGSIGLSLARHALAREDNNEDI
jgi:hypothetical protein